MEELLKGIVSERTWPWKYLSIDAQVTYAVFHSSDGNESPWEQYVYESGSRLSESSTDGLRFTVR